MELFDTEEEHLKWLDYRLPMDEQILQLFEARIELTTWNDKRTKHYREFVKIKSLNHPMDKMKIICHDTLWSLKFINFLLDLITKEVHKDELNGGKSPIPLKSTN